MIRAEKLQDLNDIRRVDSLGIFKRWIYTQRDDYHKVCDYMQKINYSIQDLNQQIDEITDIQLKDVLFIIVLVDWIIDSYNAIEKRIKPQIIQKFSYRKETEFQNAKNYLKALRSFVVAHPLTTNRHSKFGFDGDFICIDIGGNKSPIIHFYPNDHFYFIDYNGIREEKVIESDFFLRAYSDKKDKMQYSKYIGCKCCDIFNVAKLYIDKLYALDKYLSKQKKKDYLGK